MVLVPRRRPQALSSPSRSTAERTPGCPAGVGARRLLLSLALTSAAIHGALAMAPTPTAARPPASLIALDRPGNLPPVRFTPGSSEVAPEAQSELDAVASRLRADPDLRLELRAYARASK